MQVSDTSQVTLIQVSEREFPDRAQTHAKQEAHAGTRYIDLYIRFARYIVP